MKSGGCISEEAKGVARYLDVGTCCFSSRFCPRLHPSISSSISSTSSSFFFPSLSLFFYSSFRRSPIFSSSIPFLSLFLRFSLRSAFTKAERRIETRHSKRISHALMRRGPNSTRFPVNLAGEGALLFTIQQSGRAVV